MRTPRGTFGMFVAVVSLSLVTTAAAQSDVAAVLAEARTLIDSGQASAAIARLGALEDASDPRVGELLGAAYYHANDAGRAIATLTPIVDRLPVGSLESREAVQVLGLAHFLAGHIAESIPFLERTLPLFPDDIKLAYVLGMAYAQTRQPAKARESFARTFHIAADSAGGARGRAPLPHRRRFGGRASRRRPDAQPARVGRSRQSRAARGDPPRSEAARSALRPRADRDLPIAI